MKKFKIIMGIIFLSLLCAFILAVGIAHMDAQHEKFESLFCILAGEKDNHFSGESLFSAVVACITAFPGIICGFLALWQTQKLHMLENRYHRPMLTLMKADLTMIKLDTEDYFDRLPRKVQSDIRKQKGRRSLDKWKDEGEMAGLLLEFDFVGRNEVDVERIQVTKLIFQIKKEKYEFQLLNDRKADAEDDEAFGRRCESTYLDGNRVHHVRTSLYPYKQDTLWEKRKTAFWWGMENFLNFANRLDEDFRTIHILIEANIYYQYGPKRGNKMYGDTIWRVNDGQTINERIGSFAHQVSQSGYFSYNELS